MEASFWHKRWKECDIGFHEREVNPILIANFRRLNLGKGKRVFLPLCGKTRDISWLLSNNYHVVGIELSELAVLQLFEDIEIEPNISTNGTFKCYQAKDIDIFVGDIFKLTVEALGSIDAVYDRAALVALPENTRKHYANQLIEITGKAPQLLICFEYDQNLMKGPPFSVDNQELKKHYDDSYTLKLIGRKKLDGFKGEVRHLRMLGC